MDQRLEQATGMIFDCDGTLLDTMPLWNSSEAELARMAGVVLDDDQLNELRAAPIAEGAVIFHERYGLGKSPQHVLDMIDDMLLEFYRTQAQPLPGARELVEQLVAQGIPCTVVTSSPQRFVRAGFDRNGMTSLFADLITTDDTGISKQDPRIYRHAMDLMGSTPHTTWGFDDALYAIKVMASMGIHTVGAYDCDETGTFEQLSDAAEIAVRSLEELLGS